MRDQSVGAGTTLAIKKAMMTPEAFSTAYQTGFQRTSAFLRSRGVEGGRAEEFSQAAWTRGWEYRTQLCDEDRVYAWVNTIALNLVRNDCRRVRRECELKPHSARLARRFDGAWSAEVDLQRLFGACLERDQRILYRRLVRGETTSDVARSVGMSEGALRIRLHRAVAKIRKSLRPSARGEDALLRPFCQSKKQPMEVELNGMAA
jgi:DNA-directed RNA polymerase specialized sigma24 family protein